MHIHLLSPPVRWLERGVSIKSFQWNGAYVIGHSEYLGAGVCLGNTHALRGTIKLEWYITVDFATGE